jgi:dihydrolipoamide dehydrogenase
VRYDLIIIGAGPGGYVAAIKAAQLGMKVALVESQRIGGTCLNQGCIPTKSLLHAAETIREIRQAEKNGIQVGTLQIDRNKMYQQKDQVVDQLVQGVEALIKANKIDWIKGVGTIIASGQVDVSGKIYETEKILIATGSKPAVPPIPGSDLPGVITSNELLAQPNQYNQLVIIGGGVIGVEFASIFNELGCEVTIIEAADSLLPNFDSEISKKLALLLKKQGIKIATKSSVASISKETQLVCTYSSKGKELTAKGDAILIATGRKAYFEGLFAEDVAVELDRGMIKVNEFFETSIKGIYAIGDVANRGMQLAHVASAQGVNAVLAMNQQQGVYDLDLVPSCVYTTPEIASVGITEAQAKEQDLSIKIGKYNMAGNGKTIIAGSSLGFVKVIADAQSEKIIGAQMLCARATDMISEFTTAIVNELTISDVGTIIHPHPTYNEGVGEAYELLAGHGIHTMPKK